MGSGNERAIAADGTLYYTDNGAIYCGRHLGMNAAYTGRDISGQPIERVPREDEDYLSRELHRLVLCEACR